MAGRATLRILASDTLEQLEGIVKRNVHMKIHEPYTKLRTMGLFTDYKNFLRQRQLERLIYNNHKVAAKHICSLFRPPTLRRRV